MESLGTDPDDDVVKSDEAQKKEPEASLGIGLGYWEAWLKFVNKHPKSGLGQGMGWGMRGNSHVMSSDSG